MMDTFRSDFIDIAAAILICAAGLLATAISLFRLKNRDFTLLNFGLFGLILGLRWLVELPTMKTLVGFPFTDPFFHGLLTYVLTIPFSALFVNLFGRGFYSSMVWVFRSAIVYVVAAIAYDLLFAGPLPDYAIYRPLVVAWGSVWIGNVLFSRRPRDVELHVLQIVFVSTLVFVVIDQLISIGVLPWRIRLEEPGYFILFIGLGFVAVHHFLVNEQKLRAINQEIEIARRIQQSNLPANIDSSNNMRIAARYVPMSTIAGDFYDVQTTNEAGVGLLIADVSGHGVGAALIGSMLKICFASQARNIPDPAKVLTEINRILQGKMESSFITACALFIDFKNKILRYSIAGHPPPFLMRKSNLEIIRLDHAGTILGPFPNAEYENEELRLAKGDRLVLYTDGLTETKSKADELYGDQRLEAVIKAHSNASAEFSANQIVEEIVQWSGRSGGRSLDDDLTLIVADVLTEPLS